MQEPSSAAGSLAAFGSEWDTPSADRRGGRPGSATSSVSLADGCPSRAHSQTLDQAGSRPAPCRSRITELRCHRRTAPSAGMCE